MAGEGPFADTRLPTSSNRLLAQKSGLAVRASRVRSPPCGRTAPASVVLGPPVFLYFWGEGNCSYISRCCGNIGRFNPHIWGRQGALLGLPGGRAFGEFLRLGWTFPPEHASFLHWRSPALVLFFSLHPPRPLFCTFWHFPLPAGTSGVFMYCFGGLRELPGKKT
jgi:hypothetical protein